MRAKVMSGCLIVLLLSLVQVKADPILFEHYNENDDNWGNIGGLQQHAQNFTPSVDHIITSVKLKFFRVGSPGTVIVSIRETIDDKPVSNILSIGTIDGNTFTIGNPYSGIDGNWYEINLINLEDRALLSASTKYSIVVAAPNGSLGTNYACWRIDLSGSTYPGGAYTVSRDGGTNWNDEWTSGDFMFEEWGVVIPEPSSFLLLVIAGISFIAIGGRKFLQKIK